MRICFSPCVCGNGWCVEHKVLDFSHCVCDFSGLIWSRLGIGQGVWNTMFMAQGSFMEQIGHLEALEKQKDMG